ncbi:hypothetical protein [Streptomyces sp. NPDC002276]
MSDPADLPHLFTHVVDGRLVECVRPADTDRPIWYVYEDRQPLGAVHVDTEHGVATWVVEATHDRHQDLDNAVRSLHQLSTRRPTRVGRPRLHDTDLPADAFR